LSAFFFWKRNLGSPE